MRFPTNTVRIKITWHSGAVIRYRSVELTHLDHFIALYVNQSNFPRKITIKPNNDREA